MPDIVKYDPNIELWVVGEFRSDKESYLEQIKNSGVSDNIKIVDGYIPDSGIEKYFAAADIVVLPYESATQSGIVQIAYGFEKPVIATKVGGLPEVVLDGKTGYIVPPKDHKALAEAVCRFFRENKAEEFTENVRKEAYRYSWDRMNELVQRLTEKTGAHER
jgi:glycosyltransferase involved in cell wall biosynthesis